MMKSSIKITKSKWNILMNFLTIALAVTTLSTRGSTLYVNSFTTSTLLANQKSTLFKATPTTTTTANANNNLANSNNRQTNQHHHHQPKLRHQDIWTEINESIVLNCSLRVNKDQHVVWHRKYDKMGVHVLTIESETFISDLRIRPIKQEFVIMPQIGSTTSGSSINYNNNEFSIESPLNSNNLVQYDNVDGGVGGVGLSGGGGGYMTPNLKFTWNLEIRKLKREDSALYYCVLNSENSYGQIYKLNVLPKLSFLNKSEIIVDNVGHHNNVNEEPNNSKQILLICKYDEFIGPQNEQIKWFLNKYRIKGSGSNSATNEQNSKILTNLTPMKSSKSNNQNVNEENDLNHFATVAAYATPSATSNNHFNMNNFHIVETHLQDSNVTISKLYINNFNPKLHSGKYRCQYKGLFKTIKIHSNHKSNDSMNNRLAFKQSIYSLTPIFSSKSSSTSSSTCSWTKTTPFFNSSIFRLFLFLFSFFVFYF